MKRLLQLLVVMVMVLGLEVTAEAILIDNANGTITDPDTNLMWLKDASGNSRMNWFPAFEWADSLVYAGFDDWRLPSTLQPDPSCSQQGILAESTGSAGYNCMGSEMGHLFNVAGVSLKTPGLFENISLAPYWSITQYAPRPSSVMWHFGFDDGFQWANGDGSTFSTWAVRCIENTDCENPTEPIVFQEPITTVDEPTSLILFSLGLMFLIGIKRIFI